jgi:hypothetical protein
MFCCFFLIFSILNLPSVFLCQVLFDTRQSLCRVPMKSLPSVTLDKAFAECKIAFAECLRHSAKNAIPVVILSWANMSFLRDISSPGSLYDWWKRLRSCCCKESKKIFDGLLICFWWNIWLERNNRIFQGQQRSTVEVAQLVKDQVENLF